MLAYGYQKFGGPTVFEELPQSQLIPTDNQLLIKTLAVNLRTCLESFQEANYKFNPNKPGIFQWQSVDDVFLM
ncbi:hypothetical protein RAO27_04475, partial [Lactiplantibacillus plantarum]